ncbi:hypothetical protein HMPREF1554_01892 [Porphyromonas gingivalis F0569]|nr:hypothetical protein HMPREF1554_01892 [Porphyromonas gingivalis F0569]
MDYLLEYDALTYAKNCIDRVGMTSMTGACGTSTQACNLL